jgi:hypothetical protein
VASLLSAARGGETGALARLLECREPGLPVSERAAALRTAAAAGQLDATRLLLQCGTPPDARGSTGGLSGRAGDDSGRGVVGQGVGGDGATALMYAAAGGHLNCASALLDAGADVRAVAGGAGGAGGGARLSAYHAACLHGHAEVALLLLRRGADPAARAGEHVWMSGAEMAAARPETRHVARAVGAEMETRELEEAGAELLRAAAAGDTAALGRLLWVGRWRTLDGGFRVIRDERVTEGACAAALRRALAAGQVRRPLPSSAPKPAYSPAVSTSGPMSTPAPSLQPAAGSCSGIGSG